MFVKCTVPCCTTSAIRPASIWAGSTPNFVRHIFFHSPALTSYSVTFIPFSHCSTRPLLTTRRKLFIPEGFEILYRGATMLNNAPVRWVGLAFTEPLFSSSTNCISGYVVARREKEISGARSGKVSVHFSWNGNMIKMKYCSYTWILFLMVEILKVWKPQLFYILKKIRITYRWLK